MEHEVFTWASLFPFLKHLPPHVSNSIIVSVILLIIVFLGYRQLKKKEDEVVPEPNFTFKNFVEMIVESISNIVVESMGPRGKEFVLLVGTLALFILFNNLSGLVPGFLPATDNVNTTFACSITVFVMTHYYGFKEHGIKYLKHFMGPFWWLAPLMVPIELIGHFARPLSLGLRLFGNITGDHLVTAIFFGLVPFLVPLPVMFLGLFVAFVQTFVFVLLSMAYFSGAISHEEH
ncbi:MAG TPA: F0F1 ATP synthase subunit A [Syntrophorhabdaceae bacterium]|nr:F0F1 ATP synthase subunit A [Syntrophorhabdaceae bacterium]HOL06078.1 F0F1 ATP synthase subunit A [Syntrophorhabdaceae bacterium]HON85964.1 F0F1 ATP synthase subunit A [Syntrophorhabdaceae bacterium]HOT42524.1 F0F1 ATP synthase subunit A [Syntrophorhabdaceae bacterium]HPC67541.1 F0F1 ATP synthase subunit A [Syntrophorhabdaceae bacterium]